MIQEFKIKNFLSFRDEVTFSFEATKDKTFEDYQIVEMPPVPGSTSKERLLRFALVYGANASGKSNLLKALDFLRNFWFAKQDDIDKSTNVTPFRLDINTCHQPSEFEIKFYANDIRYWYQVSLDQKKVYSEKLYIYKSVQPTMLFSRQLEENRSTIKFNSSIIKVSTAAQEEISLRCLSNMSFFAARNQVNITIPDIDEARDWMRNNTLPLIEPRTSMFDYAGKKMWKDEKMKIYMLDFIHKADYNITGINTDKIKEQIPSDMINILLKFNNFSNTDKERIKNEGTIDRLKTDFIHTVKNERGIETYPLPNSLQSEGTMRTFGIEAAIYQAIQKNAFLSIDEIESSLHPDLVEFIIEKFLKEKSKSQLLITSHYDPLLNTVDDLIRKDSVWFTEKEESGTSNLYSLIEFKGLNKISSFQRSYRNGIFGALPNIKG